MILLKGHSDRAVQAHRHVTGATNTYWLNELVRYVKAQGLWDNFRFYPMMPRTNFDTGSTVRGMGGLTSNDMTLVNGPTWGASGIAFASASSQYGTIADFLGSETLTVFARNTISSTSPGTGTRGIVTQFSGLTDRSFFFGYNYTSGDGTRLFRSSDGSSGNQEAYENGTDQLEGSDICAVAQWIDGGGRSLWHNKTSQSLTLFAGAAQTSMFDESIDVLLAANDSASPTAFSNMTAHALAFVTGTLTTEQRETITDLINEL